MLYKINEGYVKSNEGYSVKVGRQHLSYIEDNNHAITFEIERMVNPYYIVVYLNESKDHFWHPPYQSIKLDSKDLQKIKNRINDVLDFLKIKYEFE